MRYGLDFGTSNSAVAIAGAEGVELIPLEPESENPSTLRTVLWIGREGETAIGEDAVNAFVQGNVGRPIVKSRVFYRETIMTEFGEEYIQFDADTGMPGRFFQAIKSVLGDPSYKGTDVFGTFVSIETLVGEVLRLIKARADAHCGQEVTQVTLGRPVRFADDPAADALAEARLQDAAKVAGFKDVHLLYEPLGAALYYESTLDHEELALVFDFGGGTLDLSLVRLGPGRHAASGRQEDILAVDGLRLGGNTFNQDIMEKKLLRYFGQRATWTSERGEQLPMPAFIYDQLRRWYMISLLHQGEVMQFLRQVRRLVRQPHQIEALISLIVKNYGWDLFQEIEKAKCALSSARHTRLQFFQEAIAISELITRTAYETMIAHHYADIERLIDNVLTEAGVEEREVDVVLSTGGTSLTPSIQALLRRRFGYDMIQEQDVFTSVVSGLALARS